jgi:hypothetical protein
MLQLPTVRTTYESSVDLIMLSSFLLIVVAQVLVFGQVETDVPRFPTPGTTWPSRIAAITRILEVHEITLVQIVNPRTNTKKLSF